MIHKTAGGLTAVSILPSGDHIASEGHDRTLTTKEGQRYHSTSYGPWEPIFPDQKEMPS